SRRGCDHARARRRHHVRAVRRRMGRRTRRRLSEADRAARQGARPRDPRVRGGPADEARGARRTGLIRQGCSVMVTVSTVMPPRSDGPTSWNVSWADPLAAATNLRLSLVYVPFSLGCFVYVLLTGPKFTTAELMSTPPGTPGNGLVPSRKHAV